MTLTEWECTLDVRGERKVLVVQVPDRSMKQAAAEVKAIKGQSGWQNGDVRCLFSRFLRDVPPNIEERLEASLGLMPSERIPSDYLLAELHEQLDAVVGAK